MLSPEEISPEWLRPFKIYLIAFFLFFFFFSPQVTAAGGLLKFTVSYDFTKQEDRAQLMVQSDVIIEVK